MPAEWIDCSKAESTDAKLSECLPFQKGQKLAARREVRTADLLVVKVVK